jgi:hypothetical protein
MIAELITFAGFFLNTANVLYLVCYAVKDVLWLRIFCVIAMLTIIPYYIWGTETIQWGCILWQLAFLALNLFWIVVILKERRPPKMTMREKRLFSEVFSHSCQPQQMLRLLSVSEQVVHEIGSTCIRKLADPEGLLLIESGKVNVLLDGKLIATLKRGDLVGEMSYLTGEPAVADVVAASTVEMVRWKRGDLEKLFDSRPDLKSVLNEIIGRDLIDKIVSVDSGVPELTVDTVSMDE